ncbi:MAG: hypothetical protein V7676_10015 [Parasphingorhabdus sp.]|uniref:hypothetical protein n=1 Tax=Parasphingorhabdus sp. TaxID=2709688 RepID=UPI003001C067
MPNDLLKLAGLGLMVIMLSAPAMAAQGERKKGALGNAADAATQPLNDLNLKSAYIPAELVKIQDEPYSLNGLSDCAVLLKEISTLEDVLGADADAPAEKTGVVNKALKTGGSFLGGFIPFRGVVREVSGANANRRKMERAIYAGVARRGFLKGYAEAKQCKNSEELAIEAAEVRMGLRVPTVTEEPAKDMNVQSVGAILEVNLPPSDAALQSDNDDY